MTDVRQTKEYSRHLTNFGWKTFNYPKSNMFVFTKKIPLTPFSILKLQRPTLLTSPNWLNTIIHLNRVIVSYAEPMLKKDIAMLQSLGYRRGKKPFLPSKTYEINLTVPIKKILSNMRKTTKENISTHGQTKLPIVVANGTQLAKDKDLIDDLTYLSKLFSKRSISTDQLKSLINSFMYKCYAVIAYYQQSPVAFTFYLTSKDSVEQHYSGSTPTGKRLKAPTICTWYGIKEAKRRDKLRFDFGGIYDDRFPIKKWKGFTQFKKGFGGKERLFPEIYYKWHFANLFL